MKEVGESARESIWPARAICRGRVNLARTGEAAPPRRRISLTPRGNGFAVDCHWQAKPLTGKQDADRPHPRKTPPTRPHRGDRDAPHPQLSPGPGPHSRPAPPRPAGHLGPRRPPGAARPARARRAEVVGRPAASRPVRSPPDDRPPLRAALVRERRDAAPARAKAACPVQPARSGQGPPDAGRSGSVALHPVRAGGPP
jgi:hypothetical protein